MVHLYVTPAGGKLWPLKYRFAGKERRLSLGPWPTVTLEQARAQALEARAALRVGQDPAHSARSRAGGETMEALAAAWSARQAWAPSTAKRERYLMTHGLPALGSIPARALIPGDIRPVILGIEARGRGEDAHRVRAQIGRVLRYAVALGHADRDAAADLGDVLSPVQSEKYATLTKPAEIAELMIAIHSYSGDPSTMYCLRLLPLVFTRPGELRNARWPEFDLDAPSRCGASPGSG